MNEFARNLVIVIGVFGLMGTVAMLIRKEHADAE
jgi:hypothetical protein